MALQSLSMASPPSSTTLQPSSTALQFASKAPYHNPTPFSTTPTTSLMHESCSISLAQLHNLDQLPASLHPCASTPSLEQQCASLLPPFCQSILDDDSADFGTNPEKSPIAQLIQEYSLVGIDSQLGSTETSIAWVLSLEELTPDLIIDRGKGRPRCYHLAKATMDDVCTVVTAQQTFIQQATALIISVCRFSCMDRKKNRNRTEHNQKRPDQQLWLHQL